MPVISLLTLTVNSKQIIFKKIFLQCLHCFSASLVIECGNQMQLASFFLYMWGQGIALIIELVPLIQYVCE